MVAKDGERVPFHILFHMTGAVETWLTRLASITLLSLGLWIMMAVVVAVGCIVVSSEDGCIFQYVAFGTAVD